MRPPRLSSPPDSLPAPALVAWWRGGGEDDEVLGVMRTSVHTIVGGDILRQESNPY